jgi:hypothetical protein
VPFAESPDFGENQGQGQGNTLWMADRSDVWRMDFLGRTVRRALVLPQGETIAATSSQPRRGGAFRWTPEARAALPDLQSQMGRPAWWRTDGSGRSNPQDDFYVLTRSGHLLLLGESEGTLADISLQGIVGPTEMFAAGHIPGKDRFYIGTKTEFLELARSGEVLARFPLPAESPVKRYTQDADACFFEYLMAFDNGMAAVRTVIHQPTATVPSLRLARIALPWLQRAMSPRLWGGGVPPAQVQRASTVSEWERARPALASGLVAFVICLWWMRRPSLPRGERIAWLLAALAFGPGVLLALVAFYDSPAKEPCPACGRKRLVTRERCEYCGAPFPPPAQTGIEIVEPAE